MRHVACGMWHVTCGMGMGMGMDMGTGIWIASGDGATPSLSFTALLRARCGGAAGAALRMVEIEDGLTQRVRRASAVPRVRRCAWSRLRMASRAASGADRVRTY